MILTKLATNLSQNEYSKALNNYSSAMEETFGVKIQSSSCNSGGLSQSIRLKSEELIDKAYKQNLQNTRSFIKEQEAAIE